MGSDCMGKGGPTRQMAFWVMIACGSCVAPARGQLGTMTFDPVWRYSFSGDGVANGVLSGE